MSIEWLSESNEYVLRILNLEILYHFDNKSILHPGLFNDQLNIISMK